MYRIINSLATAEYSKDLLAVEVKFNGHGNPNLYHETMDIAMNIALIYDTNRWFFRKEHFEDISENKFIFFVSKWSKKASELFVNNPKNFICKVALLTSTESKDFLMENNLWLSSPQQKFKNLDLKVFTEKEEVNEFLIGEPNKMLSF